MCDFCREGAIKTVEQTTCSGGKTKKITRLYLHEGNLKVVVSHKNGERVLDRTEAVFEITHCLFCPKKILKPTVEETALEVTMKEREKDIAVTETE